jgi:hypothetical protein
MQPIAVEDESRSPLRIPFDRPAAATCRDPTTRLWPRHIASMALEVGIVERMTPTCAAIRLSADPATALGHCPTPQHAAMLQAKVPVQAGTMRLCFCTTKIGVALATAAGAGS